MKTPVKWLLLLGLVAGVLEAAQDPNKKCGTTPAVCPNGDETCCHMDGQLKDAKQCKTDCGADEGKKCTFKTSLVSPCSETDAVQKTRNFCKDNDKNVMCGDTDECCNLETNKCDKAGCAALAVEKKCSFDGTTKGKLCTQTDKAKADAKAAQKKQTDIANKNAAMKKANKNNCQTGTDVLTATECSEYCCIEGGKCGKQEECEKTDKMTCVFSDQTLGKACKDYKKHDKKPKVEKKTCDLTGADVPCGDDKFKCCKTKQGDKEMKTKEELCLTADKCKEDNTDVCHFADGLKKDKKKCKSLAAKPKKVDCGTDGDVACGDDKVICCSTEQGDKEKKTKDELCLKAEQCKDDTANVCHFAEDLAKDKKKCKKLTAKPKSGTDDTAKKGKDDDKGKGGATTAAAAGPLLAGLLLLPNLIPNNN